ncbi:MAG TPA: right-handed parallel beta-helix repeat-containing protein [Bryocella sp.]|nr:right-handed parallel beta-helix repeat-containing protein [Bryocella sp.]
MSRDLRISVSQFWAISCSAAALWLVAGVAGAATLCVNHHSNTGCYSSITSALAAAQPGDVINVAQGTYAEDVLITKSISLVGGNQFSTIIDATGKSNGIYIDGLDTPGLAGVTVRGFTIQNANYEGMLIQNASNVTVSGNTVQLNDRDETNGTGCDGLPPFETNEADDCGEGIHLMGVDHSTIAENTVQYNSGGILISDETAPNHDNVITKNMVRDNAYDCGITMASHSAYVKTGTAPLAFGISHNTISENVSMHNGFGSPGGGAGVGLFAPGPGNVTIDNSVVNNRLIDNSQPGVSIHNHVNLTFPNHPPNPNVNDNAIVGNYISGNGPDSDVGTTVTTGISVLGTTPITGLVISGNTIEHEGVDVGVNNGALLELHLNNLNGRNIGVENLNAGGSVDARENWWGCSRGPTSNACSSISGPNVSSTPWLPTPVE